MANNRNRQLIGNPRANQRPAPIMGEEFSHQPNPHVKPGATRNNPTAGKYGGGSILEQQLVKAPISDEWVAFGVRQNAVSGQHEAVYFQMRGNKVISERVEERNVGMVLEQVALFAAATTAKLTGRPPPPGFTVRMENMTTVGQAKPEKKGGKS